MKPVKIMLALAAVTSISACGLRGDLERPEPIFRESTPAPAPAPAQPPVQAEPQTNEELTEDDLLGG